MGVAALAADYAYAYLCAFADALRYAMAPLQRFIYFSRHVLPYYLIFFRCC